MIDWFVLLWDTGLLQKLIPNWLHLIFKSSFNPNTYSMFYFTLSPCTLTPADNPSGKCILFYFECEFIYFAESCQPRTMVLFVVVMIVFGQRIYFNNSPHAFVDEIWMLCPQNSWSWWFSVSPVIWGFGKCDKFQLD